MFLDDPRISSVVFYPRQTPVPTFTEKNIKTLNFKIDDEISIGGVLYLKEKTLPTILMFHGNGEIAEDYEYFYKNFHDINVNLSVADFRGYGFSTGTPIYSGLINDAMPIYQQFKEWMDKNGLLNSLFILGRSLGSVCAAEIGSQNPKELKGVIFESGFASLYNMITGLFQVRGPIITQDSLREYSNDTRVMKFQKPTLVIHGTNDWIVPYDEGKLLYKTLSESVQKKLVSIEGAGHNDISSFENEYFNPLKEFVQKFK